MVSFALFIASAAASIKSDPQTYQVTQVFNLGGANPSVKLPVKARQNCYLILLDVSAGLWDWFPENISEENLSSNVHPPNIGEEEASFSY